MLANFILLGNDPTSLYDGLFEVKSVDTKFVITVLLYGIYYKYYFIFYHSQYMNPAGPHKPYLVAVPVVNSYIIGVTTFISESL